MRKGSIYRQDLINRFEVGLSAGSRDFKNYKQLAPDNLKYATKEKRYFQTEHLEALFDHEAVRTLVKLADDISDGFDTIKDVYFPVESPSNLNILDVNIVTRLLQATLNNKAVSIIYTSLSNGSNAREFVPHSIVENGLRWLVRGYDRKSKSFRDFVLTRISKVTLNDIPEPSKMAMADKGWQQLVPLELIPHPKDEPT
jgi:predicted DNA-binding transcriptional regulator YafY